LPPAADRCAISTYEAGERSGEWLLAHASAASPCHLAHCSTEVEIEKVEARRHPQNDHVIPNDPCGE